MRTRQAVSPKSPLEGLWVLLVAEEDERVPMIARANPTENYLLGFKNVANARSFMKKTSVEDAEPRMIVRGNKSEFLRMAEDAGVVGVLVDYDPSTHEYSAATDLY